MKTMSASPADALPSGTVAPSRRTVDAPTRAFHWLMALSFAGAYLTAESERWQLVHVTLGYTLVGLLVFRGVWGLIGPRPARWSVLGAKLQALPGVIRQLRQGQWPGTLAQNLAMAVVIVAVLALVALTTASGYATYAELTGDWVEEVHELAGNSLLIVVLAHIALVLGLSVLRRRNLVMPMVSGRVAGRGPDLVKRNRGWLAALMLAAVLAFWWWQWQGAPQGEASPGLVPALMSGLSDRGHDDDDD